MKVLHSICQQIWKTQQWPQDWKRSIFIPIPKKGNAKECSNYHTIVLISHASQIMPKILQARLQQYMNHELSGVQAGFRKGRGTRNQIANICWIIEIAREFQKNILLTRIKVISSKFGKLSSGHGTGKGQFSFQSQRKAMPKNAQTTTQLYSSHMLAK